MWDGKIEKQKLIGQEKSNHDGVHDDWMDLHGKLLEKTKALRKKTMKKKSREPEPELHPRLKKKIDKNKQKGSAHHVPHKKTDPWASASDTESSGVVASFLEADGSVRGESANTFAVPSSLDGFCSNTMSQVEPRSFLILYITYTDIHNATQRLYIFLIPSFSFM
jgi:hypothetical protein